MLNYLFLLEILLLLCVQDEVKAVPRPAKLVGVNVAGLKANLKTNLFDKDGPIAELGKNMEAGANALLDAAGKLKANLDEAAKGLEAGANAELEGLKTGLDQLVAGIQAGGKSELSGSASGGVTLNGGGQLSLEGGLSLPSISVEGNAEGGTSGAAEGSLDLKGNGNAGEDETNDDGVIPVKGSKKLVGVNVAGLKASLKTNLFDKDGPLAELGKELDKGAEALVKSAGDLHANLDEAAKGLEVDAKAELKGLKKGLDKLESGIKVADNGELSGSGSGGVALNGGGQFSLEGRIALPSISVEGDAEGGASGAAGGDLELSGDGKAEVDQANDEGAAQDKDRGSKKLVGANVLGLKAKLKTNLFSKNGPLDNLGKEIESGADNLLEGLKSGLDSLATGLGNAEASLATGEQGSLNIGGSLSLNGGVEESSEVAAENTEKTGEVNLFPTLFPPLILPTIQAITLPSLSALLGITVSSNATAAEELKLPSLDEVAKDIEKDIGDIKVPDLSARLKMAEDDIAKNPSEVVEDVSEAFPALNDKTVVKIADTLKALNIPEIIATGEVVLPEIAIGAEFPELLVLPLLLDVVAEVLPGLAAEDKVALKQFSESLKIPNLFPNVAVNGKITLEGNLPKIPTLPNEGGLLGALKNIINAVIANVNLEANPKVSACVKTCSSDDKE